jgi:hypothetical protein
MAKKGLWYYMNKRRKEGKPKRKPGEKGYPGPGAFDRAKSEDAKDNLLGTPELTNKYKKETPGQENINVPIKVGDTVKGGKFKNKSIKVKKIGKNDKNDITINDKPLLRVRPQVEGFKEFIMKYLEQAPNTADAMKRHKAGKAGFTDKAHLKAKGLIPRSDGEKRKSDKYK